MLSVSLDFMPAFYTKHLGLTWGERYYFDPDYRSQVEMARDRFLYDVLGEHGVGSPQPTPSPCLTIQPVDLFMRTQGAEWRFPTDGTVESWGQPWKGMTVSEILALDARAAAAHPVIDAILHQYGELRTLYGARADVLGLRSGAMLIHGPYTTAHQLLGEDLFILMYDDPSGAQRVFAKVWEIYQAVLGRISRALEAPPARRIHIGDCAASLVSADLYRACVLPINHAIAREFEACGYHSCGPSTHLLDEFAKIPEMDAIQLGPGTDLRAAHQSLPDFTQFQPLIDPMLMRDGTGDDVRRRITEATALLLERGGGTLCAWSFDTDTPLTNVTTMYETVAEAQFAREP